MASQPDTAATAERFLDLEVRIAYLEHSIAELDKVLCKATDELAQMRTVVTALQQAARQGSNESQRASLEDEVPPHY